MSSSSASRPLTLDEEWAARFARIALGHVTREYPNVIGHGAPQSMHPIFYGSFDWHSCVHSYWLLATLYRLYPGMNEASAIGALFDDALTERKIAAELAYLVPATSRGFERPYGWAWLLMLQAELLRHDTKQGRTWTAQMHKMAELFVARFSDYLPKATYPVRVGTHGSTAFALALAHEYAIVAKGKALQRLIRKTARGWYGKDRDCQAWEPSGEDFLSPALTEAECMRRILPAKEFTRWFRGFLPHLKKGEPKVLFKPARVSDRSDGRIVHLDGLNLSRAWCWRSIAAALADNDPVRRKAALTARAHLESALPHVTGDYMGEHWLASFALLALK
jgi:hypothetical protein